MTGDRSQFYIIIDLSHNIKKSNIISTLQSVVNCLHIQNLIHTIGRPWKQTHRRATAGIGKSTVPFTLKVLFVVKESYSL